MPHPSISIIIPIANNDLPVVKKTIPYIKKYISYDKLIIIGSSSIKKEVESISGVSFIDEDNLLPNLSFYTIKQYIHNKYPKAERRTGWYFQQFIKLAYAYHCANEYYLTWDSDTIPVNKIELFNIQGVPYLDFLPKTPFGDDAYFKQMSNLNITSLKQKYQNKSFITEHMLFSVKIVKQLISDIEQSNNIQGTTFFEKIINSIDNKELNLSGFSEFETYAAYVNNKYANSYSLREWKNLRNGKFYLGKDPSQQQLNWIQKEFNVISFEDYDQSCPILKMISKSKILQKSIPFKFVYQIVEPLYQLYYKLRIIIRTIIKK